MDLKTSYIYLGDSSGCKVYVYKEDYSVTRKYFVSKKEIDTLYPEIESWKRVGRIAKDKFLNEENNR